MEFCSIGETDLKASVLSLGSWNTYSRLTYEAGVELVRSALDNGINFFDVAYYRDKPHTEVLWSRLIRGAGAKREDYVLAEKLWYFDYPREPLMTQMDNMLRRIDEDYVDVIVMEHPRAGMDVAKIVAEAGEIVNSGKAKAWGMLNWVPEDIEAAATIAKGEGTPLPALAQLKYSLARRNVVEELYAPVLERTGVSLHASDTMEGGILAGIANPTRGIGIDVGNVREQIKARAPQVKAAADSLGVTPAQFALAFCLSHASTASVLFGASRPETIIENVGAVTLSTQRHDEVLAAAAGLGVAGHGLDIPYAHDKRVIGDFVA